MRLFNPVDSFDSFFSISRRQTGTDTSCWGGLGAGECLSTCDGLVYSNQCRDTTGDDCCLNHRCTTEVGDGYCRNRDNQTCEGEYVVGSGPDFPCPGPSYIVCCVRWGDMVNGTETTSTSSASTSTGTTLTSSTASTSTTGGPVPTETDSGSNSSSSSSSSSSSGLTSSQKGGIAGGIVGAVAVTSLLFFLVWWLRRRRRQQGTGEDHGDRDGDGDGDDRVATETVRETPEGIGYREVRGHEGEEKGATMLASREKQELDGSGRALHEMDSETTVTPTTPAENEKGAPEMKTRRLAELPGSLAAIAEMPGPEARQE